MKKSIIALILALILALSCFGTFALADNGPAITGEADQTVEAGTEFDALAGLTASDPEDGDLTEMITVEAMPDLSFRNGKTTPETAGEYELIYSVTDKDGNVAEAYATLIVTKKKSEEVVYKAFDFSTVEVTDNHGWEARIGEAASATASLKSGAYVIEIANPGNGDGDVQLAKAGFALKVADYKIKIWAKSTKPTYAHFIARDEKAEGWETFGAVWNARIEESIAPIELNFTSAGEGSAELLFNLGKITPEISGEEHQVPVYTADLTADGVTVEAGDGANASVAFDGTAKVTIDNYPTDGGVWSIKANIGLGGLTIEKGQKYYYSFTLNAANGQSGECLVESEARSWECRANFNGLGASAGEDVVVSAVFTAADRQRPRRRDRQYTHHQQRGIWQGGGRQGNH